MIFEELRKEGSKLSGYPAIYKNCRECEKLVKINPKLSLATARTALEEFIEAVLNINGVIIPETKENKEDKEEDLSSLFGQIKYCVNNGFIDSKYSNDMHAIREYGNDVLHKKGEKSKLDNADVYEIAVENVRALYKVIISYERGQLVRKIDEKESIKIKDGMTEGYKTEDFLPIGKYEIIRPLFRPEHNNIKIKSYRCVMESSIEGEKPQYAIVKRYLKNDKSDVTQIRDRKVVHTIRNIDRRKMPILAEEIVTEPEGKYNYLCYITNENTVILNQQNNYKKLLDACTKNKAEQKELRLGILRDILDMLISLTNISDTISIHHRSLNNECIFLTKTGNSISVDIANFEYSKIDDVANDDPNAPTINIVDFSKRMQGDQFAPPEVKDASIQFMGEPDWEQVDVYACAKLSLCILLDKVKVKSLNEDLYTYLDELSREYSYELYTVTKNILESPYMSRPTLKEYYKAVQRELVM